MKDHVAIKNDIDINRKPRRRCSVKFPTWVEKDLYVRWANKPFAIYEILNIIPEFGMIDLHLVKGGENYQTQLEPIATFVHDANHAERSFEKLYFPCDEGGGRRSDVKGLEENTVVVNMLDDGQDTKVNA